MSYQKASKSVDISKEIQNLKSKLDGQQTKLYNSIIDNLVTMCNARAGTGKTTVATMAAFDLLEKGLVSKIYYVRFPDKLVQSLGAFPGDKDQKEDYYFLPFYQACAEIGLSRERLEREYLEEETVNLETIISMRGINLKDAAVIIDESQNASFKDMKLLLTRIHDDCHVALIGHSDQVDNPHSIKERAFSAYIEHFCKKQWAQRVDLKKNYRGKLCTYADELFLDEQTMAIYEKENK
jgi:phosphate starvation-inducible protein PhoH